MLIFLASVALSSLPGMVHSSGTRLVSVGLVLSSTPRCTCAYVVSM